MRISELVGFHGSSRYFTKFDSSKILSGEGNVSFGHGIYVASHPSTGKHYAMVAYESNLARNIFDAESQRSVLRAKLKSSMSVRRGEQRLTTDEISSMNKKIVELGKYIDQAKETLAKYLYFVEINDRVVPYFLDMDIPLNHQTPNVLKQLSKMKITDMKQTGFNFYNTVVDKYNGHKPATEFLQKHGILGTKYLDAKGRKDNQKSYNYVVFDTNHVNILKSEKLR